MYDTDLNLKERANLCIAQGALTNSKHWSSLVEGVYPTHVVKASGCHLIDEDGRQYIDMICGLGANLLGYGNEKVLAEIKANISFIGSHSLPTHWEVEAAESLLMLFPFMDRVKFLKTGSDACTAAIKIARAYSGKQIILSEGYHGWHDDFVSLTPPACGVPARSFVKKLNSVLSENDTANVAAIIIEPVITDYSDERRLWLNDLHAFCNKNGILLIFDEVITGFRWPKYSVAASWGIIPDLLCIGKSMGNGWPISAVLGKTHLMNGDFFISSTFAGETGSLIATDIVCNLLYTKVFDVDKLWQDADKFISKINAIQGIGIKFLGYPTRGVLSGDSMDAALFMQEMCRQGILIHKSWFVNWNILEYQDFILSAIHNYKLAREMGTITLKGKMPVTPFAAQVRKH